MLDIKSELGTKLPAKANTEKVPLALVLRPGYETSLSAS